jgi:hypothetical protein
MTGTKNFNIVEPLKQRKGGCTDQLCMKDSEKKFYLGPGSLDTKGGRKIPFIFHLCLIKDGPVVPLFCLTNPALIGYFSIDVMNKNNSGEYCMTGYEYFHKTTLLCT